MTARVISMAKAAESRRVRVHTAAMKALVDEARERVLDARRRYMATDGSDARAMVQAQSLLLLALESFFDASERAGGRR